MLGIVQDYAFCLHSKERVPYHIVIKVALEPEPINQNVRRKRSKSVGHEDELLVDESLSRSFEDDKNSSSSSSG